jgi:hypothetical protein
MQQGEFKGLKDEEYRKNLALQMREFHENRIPVIVEYLDDFPKKYRQLEKNKYMIPKEFQYGSFIHVIRKTIDLKPDIALFLLINGNVSPRISDTFEELYEKYQSTDYFLYIGLGLESTFG